MAMGAVEVLGYFFDASSQIRPQTEIGDSRFLPIRFWIAPGVVTDAEAVTLRVSVLVVMSQLAHISTIQQQSWAIVLILGP